MVKLTPEEAGNVPIEFEGNPQKLKGSITAFKGKLTREDRFINKPPPTGCRQRRRRHPAQRPCYSIQGLRNTHFSPL